MEKTKIVIQVRGGCITGVHSNTGNIEVQVIDVDNLHDIVSNQNIDKLIEKKTKNLQEVEVKEVY